MIQWIAPLASEAPELIVVVYLVNKARSTAGFNALISSKLNQWTLLIGTLVVVHSLALGRYGVLAFDFKQSAEIWLTAAQSFSPSRCWSGSKSRSEKRSPCSFCSSRRSSSSSSSSEITRRCRSRAQSCCSSTARSTSSRTVLFVRRRRAFRPSHPADGGDRRRRDADWRRSTTKRRRLIRTAVSQFRCDRDTACGRTGKSLQQTV